MTWPEPIRQLVNFGRESYLTRRVQQALRTFAEDPTVESIHDLWHAWSNAGWSVGPAYLEYLVERLAATRGPVLDVGSGLSTVVIAALYPERPVVSLEQDLDWATVMRRRIERLRLQSVQLSYCPLRDFGGYLWYDTDHVQLPPVFELVACDGPAVFGVDDNLRASWRVGLIETLGRRGVAIVEVLLDNAGEPRAPATLERWAELGWAATHRRTSTEGVALVTYGRPTLDRYGAAS